MAVTMLVLPILAAGCTMAVTMLVLPILAAGCTDNPREPAGGGKANGATERGGGVTTASPGGANVRPNEGTDAGAR
jgi:hypothetical protein